MSEPGRFDARQLFAALARHEVEYVTIGGIAVQAHGGQRLTQDLDIAIDTSADNLARLADTLVELYARILGPGGERSDSPPTASLLGSSEQWHLVTTHGPLDVVTLPAHLGPFDDVLARAHRTPLGDLTVPIARREDLLRMKGAAVARRTCRYRPGRWRPTTAHPMHARRAARSPSTAPRGSPAA